MSVNLVLNLSGGMDSTALLINGLYNGYKVHAVSYDYNQKHRLELEKAQEVVDYINRHGFEVEHTIIDLKNVGELLESTLVCGGDDVPEGHYEQENMKETVVPNRNKIFSSIAQSIALSISKRTGNLALIGMGIHSGDHAIYPDCREEFRDADFKAFTIGNWNTEKVEMYTPFLELDKFKILENSLPECAKLKLSFDEIFKRTNTSYKPIEVNGEWYSDYKSASSVERIEAFTRLGVRDPIQYADEDGLVSWEQVTAYTQDIINTHNMRATN